MNIQSNAAATADGMYISKSKVENAIDHFSRFSGLAVGQLYLLCALVTVYEVVMRYVFNAPTQWAFEVVMVLCATVDVICGLYYIP